MRKRHVFAMVLAILMTAGTTLAAGETYWYEDYQKSLQLIEDGDLDLAASELQALVEFRPEPRAGVRIPGWQFIDYFPYYQLARVEAARGDFAAAAKHLERSEAYGAYKRRDRVAAEVWQLRNRVREGQDFRASN